MEVLILVVMVTVDLLGDATILDEANLIGISVHKQ